MILVRALPIRDDDDDVVIIIIVKAGAQPQSLQFECPLAMLGLHDVTAFICCVVGC